MADQVTLEQLPEAKRKSTASRSTYLAALFTSMLALVLVMILWMYNPRYQVLIHDLDASKLSLVTNELQQNNIDYHYESQTGNILVPENHLYHAKFVLGSKDIAETGDSPPLLNAASFGPETTASDIGPGKNFALESELARTIASIDNIQWARVHLSIENNRNDNAKNNSSASVFVRLAPRKGLGESQIASIAHLVASSVPNLSVEKITVIDQAGNLLKSSGEALSNFTSSTQYSYAQILEQSYINKIEKALAPVFGKNALRVSVEADIDFADKQGAAIQLGSGNPRYRLKKLSTTVVVDYKQVKSDDGQYVSIPRRAAELERIEKLVKGTIEFNEQRGDQIHVFNESFGNTLRPQSPTSAIFASTDSDHFIKIVLMALGAVVLAYFFFRYLIQKLMEFKPLGLAVEPGNAAVSGVINDGDSSSDAHNSGEVNSGLTDATRDYEALLSKTRQQVRDNPSHVVRVIKAWVRDNGR